MRRCFCYLLALVLGSLALGGLVFALLRTGVLTLAPATAAADLFFGVTAGRGPGRPCWRICWGCSGRTGRRPWRTPGCAVGRPPPWAPWGRC